VDCYVSPHGHAYTVPSTTASTLQCLLFDQSCGLLCHLWTAVSSLLCSNKKASPRRPPQTVPGRPALLRAAPSMELESQWPPSPPCELPTSLLPHSSHQRSHHNSSSSPTTTITQAVGSHRHRLMEVHQFTHREVQYKTVQLQYMRQAIQPVRLYTCRSQRSQGQWLVLGLSAPLGFLVLPLWGHRSKQSASPAGFVGA
jgi:hypothetical protein